MGGQRLAAPRERLVRGVEVLVLVVAADLPVAIGPEGIRRRLMTDVAAGVDPERRQRRRGVEQRRVVALDGAGQPARLPLHRQRPPLDEVLDEAVVAQFVCGFVQRVDGAIGQAQRKEGDEDGEQWPVTAGEGRVAGGG